MSREATGVENAIEYPRSCPEKIGTIAVAEHTPSGDADRVEAEPVVPEQLASLLPQLERHPDFDLPTLAYHLRQSDATARDGYWHAAINEARSFLEALVLSIASAQQSESPATLRDSRQTQSGLKLWRRYLREVGFLDPDEDLLLTYVYAVASAKGSHLGVTDEAWSRLARRIVWSTGHYLVERFGAWRAHGGRPASESRVSPRRPVRGPWRCRLAAFLRQAAALCPLHNGRRATSST